MSGKSKVFKLSQAASLKFEKVKNFIEDLPTEIEINSIHELIELRESFKNDLIIRKNGKDEYEIIIYNDYVE